MRRRSARQENDRRPRAKGPGDIEKEGFFTGKYAINPFSGERMPVWVGNFVLMGYGTGAIMAVPAHDERDFEFCKQYGISDPAGRSGLPTRHGNPSRCPSPTTESRSTPARTPACQHRRSPPRHGRQSRTGRLRQSRHHVSHQGLGHLAAALLGHADPRDPLSGLRHRARA